MPLINAHADVYGGAGRLIFGLSHQKSGNVYASSEGSDYMGGSSEGGQGVRTPHPRLENHKSIGILGNTGPDHRKNHEVIKPTFNLNCVSLAGR